MSFCYNCGVGNLKTLCNGRTVAQIASNITKYNKVQRNSTDWTGAPQAG
ncbi:hypothetical protein [Paenibacillus sp. FSL F4-0087]